MQIGQRLRELREVKNFSQGEIERRTGLLRCYVSRVENGHTVPSLETIEKFARALEVPTYQLFIVADEKPDGALRAIQETQKGNAFGSKPREKRYLMQLWHLLGKMSKSDRSLLESLAVILSKR